MAIDYRKMPLSGKSLRHALRAKSRHRREELSQLATGSATSHPIRNDLVPKLELVERVPGELGVPARNVRKIETAHVREIASRDQQFGLLRSGSDRRAERRSRRRLRVEAAKLLGLPHIPCIRANHLSTPERRLVRMALNRLGEKGSWDFDELKLELEELILENAPVEITGFSMTEVDQILIGEEPVSHRSRSAGTGAGCKARRAVGRSLYFGQAPHSLRRFYRPRALEILMSDDEARLILTDEPYNVPVVGHVTSGVHREFLMASGEMSDAEFRAFNAAWIGASLRHLRDGGLFGTFIDWRGYPAVIAAALQLGLAPLNLIVWAKTNAGMGSLYRSQHELVPLFKKGKASHVNNVELGKNGRWRSNVWTYPGASSMGSEARQGLRHHPTVKPVTILEDALLDMTERGDIVLDPFLGSGSTLVAAERTGRHCRGLELDPLYVDVILRRYEAVTGRPAVLERTGETYAELAMRRRRDAEDDPVPLSNAETAAGRHHDVDPV